MYFILVVFFHPHFDPKKVNTGQRTFSDLAFSTVKTKEKWIHKFLRHFLPAVVTTQTIVVVVFWTLLWPGLRKTYPTGWSLFFDITDHSMPFLMILTDYISNNVQHPKKSFHLALGISTVYMAFQIIYQELSGDIIYPTPLTD